MMILYDDDMLTVSKLCKDWEEWCVMNKYYDFDYEIIDLRNKFHGGQIFVAHNLWKESGYPYCVDSFEKFSAHIISMINQIIEDDDEFFREYGKEYWKEKVQAYFI